MKRIGYKEAVKLVESFHIIKTNGDSKISVYRFDEYAEEHLVGNMTRSTFDKLKGENKIRFRRQEQGTNVYW